VGDCRIGPVAHRPPALASDPVELGRVERQVPSPPWRARFRSPPRVAQRPHAHRPGSRRRDPLLL